MGPLARAHNDHPIIQARFGEYLNHFILVYISDIVLPVFSWNEADHWHCSTHARQAEGIPSLPQSWKVWVPLPQLHHQCWRYQDGYRLKQSNPGLFHPPLKNFNIFSAFTTVPLNRHPDPKKPFTVEVYASNSGMGAVHSQKQGNPANLSMCIPLKETHYRGAELWHRQPRAISHQTSS